VAVGNLGYLDYCLGLFCRENQNSTISLTILSMGVATSSSTLNPLSPAFLIPLFVGVMILVFVVMTRRMERHQDAILGSTVTPEEWLRKHQQRAAAEHAK